MGDKPAADLEQALRLVTEARRLYDAAELVHGRTVSGVLDSAPLLGRALHLAGAALLALEGTPLPTWEQTSTHLVQANKGEHFVDHDLEADLAVLERVVAVWSTPAASDDRALARDYDRVFARSARLIKAISSQVESRRPASAKTVWKPLAAVAAVTLLAGALIGRWTAPHPDAAAAPKQVAVATETARPGQSRPPAASHVEATYYADETFGQPLKTEPCPRLEFDWQGGAPPALSQNDHFSVRFTGTVEAFGDTPTKFFLSSDDGSRLYIDDQPVIDNWGVHVTATRDGELVLTSGKHKLRVEYFDGTGDANVKLEWSAAGMSRTVVESKE